MSSTAIAIVALALAGAAVAVLASSRRERRLRRRVEALERAEREHAEISVTLQRGLLPSPLPHIPGWSVAAMYRPAGAENEVGGDFYDVFRVPGGWMLAVGDVTGHGAAAATVTAVARYTLRTAALLSDDPLKALDALNRALLARDAALCSLAAVTIAEDPREAARLAVAGHPPPLLVDEDSVVAAMEAESPVLGAFADASWQIGHRRLEPGQQLTIVTDGVIEAEGEEGRFGEERLRRELVGMTSPGLALQHLEGALHAFTGGALEDDVAILSIGPAGG